jgi:hypothetical protein
MISINIEDYSLIYLENCKALRSLEFDGCVAITDVGVQRLGGPAVTAANFKMYGDEGKFLFFECFCLLAYMPASFFLLLIAVHSQVSIHFACCPRRRGEAVRQPLLAEPLLRGHGRAEPDGHPQPRAARSVTRPQQYDSPYLYSISFYLL